MKRESNFLAILPVIHMIEKIQKELNANIDLTNSIDKNRLELDINEIVSDYNTNTSALRCCSTFATVGESLEPCAFMRFHDDNSFIIRITKTEWKPIWT